MDEIEYLFANLQTINEKLEEAERERIVVRLKRRNLQQLDSLKAYLKFMIQREIVRYGIKPIYDTSLKRNFTTLELVIEESGLLNYHYMVKALDVSALIFKLSPNQIEFLKLYFMSGKLTQSDLERQMESRLQLNSKEFCDLHTEFNLLEEIKNSNKDEIDQSPKSPPYKAAKTSNSQTPRGSKNIGSIGAFKINYESFNKLIITVDTIEAYKGLFGDETSGGMFEKIFLTLLKHEFATSNRSMSVSDIISKCDAQNFEQSSSSQKSRSDPNIFLKCQQLLNQINDCEIQYQFITIDNTLGNNTSFSSIQNRKSSKSYSSQSSSSLGTLYRIDWGRCVQFYVHQQCLEYIDKEFGVSALRIVQYLVKNGPCTQIDLEKACFVESNFFRETIFKLIVKNILNTLNFSKTPDFNPSKTLYILELNYNTLVECVFSKLKLFIRNMFTIKNNLYNTNFSLLNKCQKIRKHLKSDPEAINYTPMALSDYLNEQENEKLEKHTRISDYIDASLLRSVGLMTFLRTYLKLDQADLGNDRSL